MVGNVKIVVKHKVHWPHEEIWGGGGVGVGGGGGGDPLTYYLPSGFKVLAKTS